MTASDLRIFRFGEFEADEALRELRRAGHVLAIQPKPLRLLFFLIRHPDRVLSKSDLLSHVWPGVTVGEAALTSAMRDLRRVLGNAGASGGPIRTVHGEGYRFTAPFTSVPHAPTAPASPAKASDPELDLAFVDRESEVAALRQAFDLAQGGAGQLRLLVGPAGIGKTHIARKMALDVGKEGARVYTAWCDEPGGHPPFSIWIQILRAMLQQEPDPGVQARWLGWTRPVFAQLVPEVCPPDGSAPDLPPPLDPEPSRARLFDAIVELLTRSSSDAPQLLVLDDLHWSDDVSLQALRYVIHHLGRTRTLVIATLRESELSTQPELGRVLAAVARTPHCAKLRLTGLSETWVSRVLAAHTGGAVHRDTVRRVYTATQGNPFFVTEVARLLASHPHDLTHQGAGSGLPLPERVLDAIEGLLSRLTPSCRELLGLAAGIGSEFGIPLLTRASEHPAAKVLDGLSDAERAGLVTSGEGAGTCRFAHPLVRDAIYARLTEGQRMHLHGRIGVALESACGGDTTPHVMELSRHFHQAAPAGFATQGIRYARDAAQRCLALSAWTEAEAHLGRALEMLPLLDERDPDLECRLLTDRAAALRVSRRASGQRWSQTAAVLLDRAIDLARTLGDTELLGRAASERAQGHLYSRTPPFDSLVRRDDTHGLVLLVEDALRAQGSAHTATRVQLTLRLADLVLLEGDSQRAEALFREATRVAERLGNGSATLIDTQLGVWSRLAVDRIAERQAIVKQVYAHCGSDRALSPYLARAAFSDAVDHLELGDLDTAESCLRRLRAIEGDLSYRTESFEIFESMRAALQGRFADAERHSAEARALMERLGYEPFRCVMAEGSLLFGLRCTQGSADSLVTPMRISAGWVTHPLMQLSLALVCAQADRLDEAHEAFLRVRDVEPPRDADWLGTQAMCAEVCALLGDVDRAREIYARLLPFADRVALLGGFTICLGSVSRPLALLAHSFDDRTAATHHFEAAIAMHARLGARPWVVRCQLELARCLLACGDEARDRAHALIDEATPAARELGLDPLLEPHRQEVEPRAATPPGSSV